jgi:hypothetical protein
MSINSKETLPASLVAAAPGSDFLEGWGFEQLAVDPATPAEGVVWYNTNERRLKWRSNGVNQTIAHTQEIAGSVRIRGGFATAALPTAATDTNNSAIALANGDTFVFNGATSVTIAGIQGFPIVSTGDLLMLVNAANPAVAGSWLAVQRNLDDSGLSLYTDLPLGGTIPTESKARLTSGQTYNFPQGAAGLLADVFVRPGTGAASIAPAGTDKIKGLTAAYNLAAGSSARFAYDLGTGNWEPISEPAIAAGGGADYSNWNTFAVSIEKTRASGETYAAFITSRIGNTVGLPVEAGLTADAISIAMGLGTVAPITLTGVGTKPVVVRSSTGNTTYTGAGAVPPGLYNFAYNGIEIVADRLEGAAALAISTPANFTGLRGQSQRVNAAETALEFFTSGGSVIGSANNFASLPTANGQKNAIEGDWAYLSVAAVGTGSAIAPQYPTGFYRYTGGVYQFSFSIGAAATGRILDSWLGTANTDWDTYGSTSFRQIIMAIGRTQLFLSSANTSITSPFDWNDAYTRLEGLIGFEASAEQRNAPRGMATGSRGFASRTGTAANGELFLFVANGAPAVNGFWYRSIRNSVWSDWARFSGDEWVTTVGTAYQATSGMKIRIIENCVVTLNFASQGDAIRAIPDTNWANVRPIIANQGYTVSGQPTSGTEEIILLPAASGGKTWDAKMVGIESVPTAPSIAGGEKVKPFSLRIAVVNGARCMIRYGGTTERTLPVDANTIEGLEVEFQNGWRLISQQTIPSYIDDTWYPIGFEIKNAGNYYKRRVDGVSQIADLTNTALWDPLSSVTPLATGATATANGTAGLLPAAPMGNIGDFLRRDGTYAPQAANGSIAGRYTPSATLPSGTGMDDGDYWLVAADGTLGQPLAGVTLRNGDELVASKPNPTVAADWFVRPRATTYQAGTAAMVVAGDTIEHVYTGAELGNSIRQVISNLGGISNYSSLASLTYGASVAGGLRYAISIANNKIYRATAATISNRALDPSLNPSEWETINEFNSFPFTAGTTLDFAPLELEAQSLVFIHSSNGAPQELKFKGVTTFGKKIVVDGVDVTAAATAAAGVTTVSNVTKGLLYQNFTNQSATSGTTYFVDLSSSINATCPNLANSESVTFGVLRSVLIGGTTRAYIRYGGSTSPRTTDTAATTTGLLTEFNNGWNFVCQTAIPVWATSVIYPIGFNVSDGTKIYENLVTATSAANDLTDAAKWRVVGNIANYLIRDIVPAGSTLTMLDLREYVGTAGASGSASAKLAAANSSQQHVEFINSDGGTYTIGLTTATDTLNGVANGTILSNTKGEHLRFICTAAGIWLETSAKSGFLTRGTIAAASAATLSNLFEYAGTAGVGIAAAPKLPAAAATTTEQRIEFINDGGVYTFGLAAATDTLNGVANGTIISRRKGEHLVFVGQSGPWTETNRVSLNDTSIGFVLPYPGNAVPNDGWLAISGQIINDVDYPDLAPLIRSGQVKISASTTANTITLKNWNSGAGPVGGLGYYLGGRGSLDAGTLLDDATAVNGLALGTGGSHTHDLNYSDGGGGAGTLPAGGGDAVGSVVRGSGDMSTAPNHSHALTGDTVTRPYTATVLWCVRSKPSPVVLGDNATLVINYQTIRHTVTYNGVSVGLASEFSWSLVRVPVAANMQIDTVSASIGSATVADPLAGMIWVIAPVGGGTMNLSTTEIARNNGTSNRTIASRTLGTALLLTNTAQNLILDVPLLDGDQLILLGDYNNDAAQSHSVNYIVKADATFRANAWPATDHNVVVTFPSTLTNTIQISHGAGSTQFRIRSYQIKRDLPVGYVAPVGMLTYATRQITGSVTAIGRDNTAISLVVPGVAADQELDTFAAPGASPVIEDRRSRRVMVTPNGADVVTTHTTRFWRRTLTSNIAIDGVATMQVEVGKPTPVAVTMPTGHLITNATITNGTVVRLSDAKGLLSITPSNAGDMALTITTTIASTPRAPLITEFLASGTWTPAPGMTYARIIGVGGGGSGGYGFGSAGANQIYAGCGGYGGAEIDIIITAAQAGVSVPITIGAGGTSGNPGGNTLIGAAGAIAVANGGGSGGGQYSYCDGSLTSCSVAPVNGAATFAVNIGRDVGSKEGSYPSTATLSIQSGSKGSFALSQGGGSRFSEGARPLRLSGPHLTGAGAVNATAGAANTGSGGSGDCVYSCNGTTNAGGSSGAAGGSGRVRIIEYF